QGDLLLLEIGFRAKGVIFYAGQQHSHTVIRAGVSGAQLQSTITEGVGEQRDLVAHLGGAGQTHVNGAVLGVATDDGRVRAFEHFNVFRRLVVAVEKLIGVTEASGAQRYAVLRQPKGATGAGAGEHRRTDGHQLLLATAATDPHTGGGRQ